jgi:cytochrome b subunit of formate dehydrogenase
MDTVLRFGPTERVLHWLCAGLFFAMLVTGFVMGRRGGLVHQVLYTSHLAFGGLLVAGVALIVWRGDRRRLGADARQVGRFDQLDRRWLRSAPEHLLGLAPEPPAGRFNAGQKLNTGLTTFVILPGLLLTGLLAVLLGHHSLAAELHKLAIIAACVLVGGHLYMALLNPRTRPSASGMVSGRVDRAWASEHHPRGDPDDA